MKRGRSTRLLTVLASAALAAPLAMLVGSPAAAQAQTPAAPSGLEVIDLGPNHVTVTWDPVPGVSKYEIEEQRRPDWRRWRGMSVDEPVATVFLEQGTTARLRVRGYGGGTVWSDWSAPVEFTTLRDRSEPAPLPDDLTVVEADPVELTVGWQPPTDGQDALSYRVQVSQIGVSCCPEFHLIDEPQIGLRLQPDARYRVRVEARATMGRSGYTDWFEFRTPAQPAVPTPTGVELDPSAGVVAVSWQPVEAAGGVRDYRVSLAHDAGPQSTTTSGTRAEFKVPEGGEVEVTVQARDTAGRLSEHSRVARATVPAADGWEELGAPRNLRVVFDDRGIVDRLEWDPASGGAGGLKYSFDYRFGSEDDFGVFFTTGQTAVDIRSMIGRFVACSSDSNPGDTFIVQIRALAQGRESPPSNQVAICFR